MKNAGGLGLDAVLAAAGRGCAGSIMTSAGRQQLRRAAARSDTARRRREDSSGMKPERQLLESSGNGPTDWPCSIASVSPLNTSMPASVTMKDGILK